MSDLAVGPSRNLGDGFTDGSISKGERFEVGAGLRAWLKGLAQGVDPQLERRPVSNL
jgi:hypothetical protein